MIICTNLPQFIADVQLHINSFFEGYTAPAIVEMAARKATVNDRKAVRFEVPVHGHIAYFYIESSNCLADEANWWQVRYTGLKLP